MVYDLTGYSPEDREKDLMKALSVIRRGYWRTNMEMIKDALWKVCGEKFGNKETFEKAWNDELIGKLMHKMGFPRIHKYYPWWEELADGTPILIWRWEWLWDIRTVPTGEEEEF